MFYFLICVCVLIFSFIFMVKCIARLYFINLLPNSCVDYNSPIFKNTNRNWHWISKFDLQFRFLRLFMNEYQVIQWVYENIYIYVGGGACLYIYIYISKQIGPLRDLYFLRIIYFVHTLVYFPACCFRQRTYEVYGHINGAPKWDTNSIV